MLRLVLATSTFAALTVSTSRAQLADERRGLWLALGCGAGSVSADCSVCTDAQDVSLAGRAVLGGTVSSRILASVEAAGWVKGGAAIDRSFWIVSALGTFYPALELGLHVKGGLGGYWYAEEDSATELTTQGMALQLGVGYDLRIAPGVSLSPFGTVVTSGFGNPTRIDKASGFKQPLFSDITVRFFQFGIAVTLH